MDGQIRGFPKTLTSELVTPLQRGQTNALCAGKPASKLSGGGEGVGEGKGVDLIGQFLTSQQQRGHGGFLGRNSNL